MKKKDLNELKTKNIKDLIKKLNELRKELVQTKIESKMDKIKNIHSVSQKKRDIAQVTTIINLKSQEGEPKSAKTMEVQSATS